MAEHKKPDYNYEVSKEMTEKYAKVFGYDPDIEESCRKFSPQFDAEIDEMLDKMLGEEEN